MKRLFYAIAIAAMLTPVMQSCNGDDDTPSVQVYQNVATFDGNYGEYCRFSYQAIDDSPLITLQAKGNVTESETQKPGMRVFISYSLIGPMTNLGYQEVDVKGISRVYEDTVTSVSAIPADFTDNYSVTTLTRSGNYLNLFAITGEVGFNNRKFTIVADEATLTGDYPELYICMENKKNAVPTADTRVIASFNIEPVWSLANVKGVKVYVASDSGTSQTEYTFKKQ